MSHLKVIVGLGNPGLKYRFTRHNIGFMVIEYFANDLEAKFKRVKSYNSMMARERFGNQKIILAEPQTYMNLSGIAVKKIVSYYKIPTQDLLIVYDDFNLQFNQIRIRKKGSSGGHNGMESIIQYLGTEDIPRLRIGIGKTYPISEIEYSDFVLSNFVENEHKRLKKIIAHSSMAIKTILTDGFDKAMIEYNKKQDLS